MKRTFILSIFLLSISFALSAQVGLGVRGIFGMDGNAYGGLEFSIQKPGVYELDLGTYGENWKMTGMKHLSFIDRNNFGVYGGGGLGLGYYDRWEELYGTFALNLGTYVMFGRMQLGFDWRPEWNFFNSPGNDLGFNVAMSARWMFGRR